LRHRARARPAVTKYHGHPTWVAVFSKRKDNAALKLNKIFALHLKIVPPLFLGLVLQGPNL
jgi:hypothetical protein